MIPILELLVPIVLLNIYFWYIWNPGKHPFHALCPEKVLFVEVFRLEESTQSENAQVLASVLSTTERITKTVLRKRQRQEDEELEVSLGYTVRPHAKQNKINTKGKTLYQVVLET